MFKNTALQQKMLWKFMSTVVTCTNPLTIFRLHSVKCKQDLGNRNYKTLKKEYKGCQK